MLRFCEQHGVRLHVQPVLFGRDAFDESGAGLALDAAQIRTLHRQLAEWKRQGRALMFSASAYAGVDRWADHTVLTHQSTGDSGCMAGDSTCTSRRTGTSGRASSMGGFHRQEHPARRPGG
jgi:hypothetical protein